MNLPFTFAAVALAISVTHGRAVGEEAPKLRNIRIIPQSIDFEDNLDGVSKWELGKGLTLSLRMNGDTTEFVGADGKLLYSVKAPEFVRQAVTSDSGACVLFSIWRKGNYSQLIRAMVLQGQLDTRSFWPGDGNLIPDRRWWVHDLGAVSDDGTTVLANFGEDGHIGNRILYRWQTWQLDPAKRIGIGLTVANGRKKE
ncbi:MAG: hypothetical protein EOP84_14915 [Verrucomicrobiaceae bacterium]|nr:MAG: hypothetical protein EOP84_14915 [Verrucomicrobiaceae bacterium]